MRTFVIGDIHGGYKALKQVLERANFDFENDRLISLGDVADGWPDVAECIELLLSIKNLVRVKGNHDEWAARFLDCHEATKISNEYYAWYTQGGKATVDSYEKHPELKEKHIKYLDESLTYFIDEENRIYMHAGFNPELAPEEQEPYITRSLACANPEQLSVSGKKENPRFFWDRSFIGDVSRGHMDGTENFKEIYIGHTPTISEHKHGRPVNFGNVWNMDTGGTYMGKMSLMNVETKELFQSDPVFLLYPEHKGRNGALLAQDPDWNKWGLFYDDPRYYSTEPGFKPERTVGGWRIKPKKDRE
jgi:serine/threonine protein phosphatase 1